VRDATVKVGPIDASSRRDIAQLKLRWSPVKAAPLDVDFASV